MKTLHVPAARLPTPGRMVRVDGFGERIALANVDGIYHAVSATCSHEDASLLLGALRHGTLSCPLHGSRFCLRSGQPLEEPATEPITVYRCHVTDHGIELEPPSGEQP